MNRRRSTPKTPHASPQLRHECDPIAKRRKRLRTGSIRSWIRTEATIDRLVDRLPARVGGDWGFRGFWLARAPSLEASGRDSSAVRMDGEAKRMDSSAKHMDSEAMRTGSQGSQGSLRPSQHRCRRAEHGVSS
jgi:hypothetical protein